MLFLSLLVALLLPAPEAAAESPHRRAAQLFGEEALIEVLVEPEQAVESALDEAVARLTGVADLLAPLEDLNRQSSAEGLSPELLSLLFRSLEFCYWSGNAYGPLGGRLADLWREDERAGQERFRAAAETAACDRLRLDREAGTVGLEEGSRLDLTGFRLGFAVDLATEALLSQGVVNARVRLGPVIRAIGGGPEGQGWRIELPEIPSMGEPLEAIRLRDQTLAMVLLPHRPTSADRPRQPLLDQRSGRPVHGVEAVFAVTELGLDAQGLASSLFILGSQQGQFRASNLRPQPSVLWLLGTGDGVPLISAVRWLALRAQ